MKRSAIGIYKFLPLLTAAKNHGCFCGNGKFKFLFSSFLAERTQVVLPPRFLAAGRYARLLKTAEPMKKIWILIALFLSNFSNAQLVSQINEALKIPDSLGWQKEIRIYEFASITNYRSLLRLYQNDEKKWKIEYSKYYYSLGNQKEDMVKSIPVLAQTNFDILWLKILDTDIEHLSQWRNIEYKLKEKGEIKLDRGEYELTWKKKIIMDGNSYMIIIRDEDNFNAITYPNPEEYFKTYSKVDELDSVNQLLNLIENEFRLSKL